MAEIIIRERNGWPSGQKMAFAKALGVKKAGLLLINAGAGELPVLVPYFLRDKGEETRKTLVQRAPPLELNLMASSHW